MEIGHRKLRKAATQMGENILRHEENATGDDETTQGTTQETTREILRIPDGEKASRTAALMMIWAAAQTHGAHAPSAAATLQHWEEIVTPGSPRRFLPIIPVALRIARSMPEKLLERVLKTAREAIPHADARNIGREIQELAPKRRQLAVYHTTPESAAMMAHLAIPPDQDWGDPGAAAQYRVADYACGTGELLTAAYRRVRELHQRAGGDPSAIHQSVMSGSMTGMDILPASACMTAANLDALEDSPREPGGATLVVPLGMREPGEPGRKRGRPGKSSISLGSLDLLDREAAGQKALSPIGRGAWAQNGIRMEHGSQDLVIMNPPFTRITSAEDLDLCLPGLGKRTRATEAELSLINGRLAELRRDTGGSNGNGLAFYFSHLADRMVKPGGTISMLLPASMLSAGGGNPAPSARRGEPQGWQVFRERIARNYRDVTVVGIAAYENQCSTFSDDTTIAEIMITARKLFPWETPVGEACFATLSRQPQDEREAVRMARAIRENELELRGTLDRENRLMVGQEDVGNAVTDRLLGGETWPMGRTIRPGIIRAAREMENGMIRLDLPAPPVWIPMATISDIAHIGISEFDIRSILEDTPPDQGDFRVLKNHNAAVHRALETNAEHEMSIRPGRAKAREKLEKSESWLHLNDNYRYNSQPTAACLTPEPTLGGRGWPNVRLENQQYEKALAIWMNSTPGLVSHWAKSNHTQNGLGFLSMTQMKKLRVLDVTRLTPGQVELMSQIFDENRDTPMLPANEAWHDPVRQELDRRLLRDVLGLPRQALRSIEELRNQWCMEPTVMGRKGATAHRQADMAELTAMTG